MTPSGLCPCPRSHIVEPVTTASIAALVSRYGLLAVFGGTLLEGEGILIVAATLSAQGVLDPVRVWLAASTGAWLGHVFWFGMGRAIRGRRLALGSAAFRARAAKVKRLIEARPVTAILLLQYLYGLRLVGAVALGLTELSLLRFVLYQIVNCLVWAGLIGGVAYLLGGLVTEFFHGWFKWIWMLASAVLVVLLLRLVDRLLDRIKA
jgi:membrane protein DedA with SNARE-associated domain